MRVRIVGNNIETDMMGARSIRRGRLCSGVFAAARQNLSEGSKFRLNIWTSETRLDSLLVVWVSFPVLDLRIISFVFRPHRG